jgi:putative tricarboxylic transport membrane protein
LRGLRKCDIVAGVFIALLGAVVIIAASQIRGDIEERLPPRTLPYAVGFMTFAGGLGLAVKSYRFRGEDPEVQWPEKDGWVRIGVNLLLLALFTALMDPLGMPISTGLYIAGAILYLDRKRILAALLTGAGSAVVVYYLFIKLLGLSFPLGPLAG